MGFCWPGKGGQEDTSKVACSPGFWCLVGVYLKPTKTRKGRAPAVGKAWASHSEAGHLDDRLWVVGTGLGPALALLSSSTQQVWVYAPLAGPDEAGLYWWGGDA